MAVLRRAPGAPPRATLVVVLLVATLALAALLAYEAHDAVRAHRATAERAVRDYATLTAWERLTALAQAADSVFAAAVRPATATRASSPWEELPPPALLAASARAIPGCPGGSLSPALFRLVLKDSSLALAAPDGAPLPYAGASSAPARWLADTVVAHARATYQAGARYALVLGSGRGEGRAVLYGVRDAQFGAPIAVYGVITCRAALG